MYSPLGGDNATTGTNWPAHQPPEEAD
jgi:hypothetical protein